MQISTHTISGIELFDVKRINRATIADGDLLSAYVYEPLIQNEDILASAVGSAYNAIDDINRTLQDKKDKQDVISLSGSATKTIKNITQNENGEMTVEFQDIDLPPEVPNVELISTDNSIAISATSVGNDVTYDLSIGVAPTGSSNKGVYEFTVTKVLDGSGAGLWAGDGLTVDNINETFVNCTSATCPVHIVLDSYGRLKTILRTGYNSITCISHTYVSQDANFANELGMWGYDDLCQVIAGMNRTWHLQHNGMLDQNGIRSTTGTLKTGTLTIKFTFVFEVL